MSTVNGDREVNNNKDSWPIAGLEVKESEKVKRKKQEKNKKKRKYVFIDWLAVGVFWIDRMSAHSATVDSRKAGQSSKKD